MKTYFRTGGKRKIFVDKRELAEFREGNGTPLQYSGLENFMDRGAWRATVHGVSKSQIRLSVTLYVALEN